MLKHLLLAAAATTAVIAAPAAQLVPNPVTPNPPAALPRRATDNDDRWQPVLDYDRDSCYNVPAIGTDGKIAEGLPHELVGYADDCREPRDLANTNVYSRQRCNNGWCAYVYDYYFEKDVAVAYARNTGHRHEWEHVVVWVRNNQAEYVAASRHGGYTIRKAKDVRWYGTHPKIVYHKEGGASTHAFRFAKEADDKIENHTGLWFREGLVSYNGFPSVELRNKLFNHNFGKATMAIKDSTFAENLKKAMPKEIKNFDVNRDDGSPGWP